jgi:hypothetical protein
MVLWFLGTALLSVWWVFRDPRFDYRLLLVGALVPDIIDIASGRAQWAHSLLVAVAVLAVVMATTGRRPVRRLVLGLPIGMLLHLVFDGAFANSTVFWWPFLGDFEDNRLPSLSRGLWNVPLEVAGAIMLVWVWRRFGFTDPVRRRQFLADGTIEAPA